MDPAKREKRYLEEGKDNTDERLLPSQILLASKKWKFSLKNIYAKTN